MFGARPEIPADAQAPGARGLGSRLAFGLGFAALGVAMVGGQLGWIWYRVHNGATEVTIFKKLLGGGFAVIFMGLLYVLGGSRVMSVFENMNRGLSQIKWYEWLVLLGVCGAALACYLGVLHYLETLGFTFT
jgi:uncharacterized membrane protein YidH (DUF202 family)